MDGLATGVKKFDGTGYEVWSTLMEAVLTAKRIKFVLDETEPTADPKSEGAADEPRKRWANANEQAKALILMSLSDEMVSLVISCATAKDIWNRLKQVHSERSESSKMMLLQEFYSIKMQLGSKVSSYVAATELIAKKLRDVGTSIDDETLIGKIISGLTPDFKHFASSWMSIPPDQRTYSNLLPRLLAEEAMMARSSKEEPVALKASVQERGKSQRKDDKKKGTKKTDLECYHCGKKGHLKRECRSLKREQEANDAKKYAVVASQEHTSREAARSAASAADRQRPDTGAPPQRQRPSTSRALYPDLELTNVARLQSQASSVPVCVQPNPTQRSHGVSAQRQAPITLTEGGKATTTAPSVPQRTLSLSWIPQLTKQAGGARPGNVTFAANTSAAHSSRVAQQATNRPAATGAGMTGAASSKGGLSPSKMLSRIASNFEWSLKDRAKRNVASKYARLAMAVNKEPLTFDEAISGPDASLWKEAIDSELNALIKNETWEVVPKQSSMREISVKWIFKHKLNADGSVDRCKARLVTRDFSQIAGIDYDDVYAPVVHADSLRLLFAICAQFNLSFKQFDIATAFLNGEVEEELYIQPPQGLDVPPNHTLRLLKSLYGLKQAPRCFNKKFKQVFNELGMRQINSDPCVFTGSTNELLILTIYVDDGIVLARRDHDIDQLLSCLKRHFEMKVVDSNYFLGLEIVQNKDESTIFLHQRGYLKRVLERFGFAESRAVGTPLEAGHSLNKPEVLSGEVFECEYAELVGSLNYIATRTRPDISFALSVCSKYTDKPRKQHWQALKRVLRYLQGTQEYGLLYKPAKHPQITVYSDADYGGDHENRRSTSGMVCLINHGPVSYKAQQQQIVTMSTTEAEYIACTLAVKEIMWIKTFLLELGVDISTKATLLCDNQSAIRLIKNSELHQRTKHIDIRHHFIRERYEEGLFEIQYVPTDQQKADLFTKALTKDKHHHLCREIGCVAYGVDRQGGC
jgi:hypothetical protein